MNFMPINSSCYFNKIDKLLQRTKLPKLTQEKIENLNSSLYLLKILSSQFNNFSGPDGLTDKLCQTFKE